MKLFDKRNIVLIMSIFLLLMMVSSVSAADVSDDAVVGNDAAIDTITSTDTDTGSIDDVISAEVSDNPKEDPSDSDELLSGDIVADASSNNDNINKNAVDDSSQDVLKASTEGDDVLRASYTVHVATTGSDNTGDGTAERPYATLQHAIDQCTSSSDTYEIIIHGGTYSNSGNRNVDVSRSEFYYGTRYRGYDFASLTIRAADGETVTFDGTGSHKNFHVRSNNVHIQGINFKNATGTQGVNIEIDANNITIDKCTFRDSGASNVQGGAIHIDDDYHDINITNSVFENCYASVGGALRADDGANRILLKNCTFNNNTAGIHGGAICMFGNNITLEDCRFTNNSANSSGAVHFHTGSSTVKNCNFTDNKATGGRSTTDTPEIGYGGALALVYRNNQGVTVTGCNFKNNTAAADGGAIQIINGSNAKILDSTFEENSASYGGAISIVGNKTTVDNATFINNNAKNTGKGHGDKSGINDTGGAIFISGSDTKINNSTFNENSAQNGSAVYIVGNRTSINDTNFDENVATLEGGAVFVKGNNCNLTDSTFTGNTAGDDGGAIYWEGNNGNINNSKFTENTGISNGSSNSKGGAICLTGNNVAITDSTFTSNSVINSDSTDGGAIFITGNNTKVINSNFTDNNASRYAGAIQVIGNNTNITNCNFEKNNAIPNESKIDDGLGGAVYIQGDNCHVELSNFTNNTARNGSAIYVNPSGDGTNYIDNCVFVENQAWVYWLPILYDEVNNKIETNLTGGNNILNAIYNNGTRQQLKLNGTSPEDGWQNSAGGSKPYQDDLEKDQYINITVYNRQGEVVFNGHDITNLSGTAFVEIPANRDNWYKINMTHTEDPYYKYITNITAINIDPAITVTDVTMYEGNDSVQHIYVNLTNKGKALANEPVNVTVLYNDVEYILSLDNKTGTDGILQINESEYFKTFAPGVYDITAVYSYLHWDDSIKDDYVVNVTAKGTLTVLPYVWNLTKSIIAVNGQPYKDGMDIYVSDNITFNITVSNLVDADITSVNITDLNTDNLTYVETVGDEWAYVGSNVWSLDNLPAKGNSSLIVTFLVTNNGTSINVANASIFNGQNKSANVSFSVKPNVVLSIEKTANASDVLAGDYVTFTINVTNNGPSNATEVVVADALPDGFTTDDKTSFTIDFLKVGDSKVFTISALAVNNGTWTNVANASCFENKTVVSDEVDVTIGSNVVLSIVKEASADSVLAGESVVFTITVTNNGPSNATMVVVEDALPAGFTTTGDTSFTIDFLEIGDSKVFTIEALAVNNGTWTNLANASCAENKTAVSDDAVVTVVSNVVLSIEKTANATEVLAGDYVTFTINVTNNGPSNATEVVVADALPDGFTTDDKTDFTIDFLKVGDSKVFTISALAVNNGTWTNVANASCFENETVVSDDASVTVRRVILDITKTASPNEILVGENVTFTITVTNKGDGNGTNLVVSDLLNESFKILDYSDKDKASVVGQNITWKFDKIDAGQSVVVTVTVNVTAKGKFNNTAAAVCDQNKTITNNSTNITVRQVILDITKTASPSDVLVGDNVTFTITVTNKGDGNATNANITDVLDKAFKYVSSTPKASVSGQNITWNIGKIAPGKSVSVNVTVTVMAAGTFNNTAAVVCDQNKTITNNSTTITSKPLTLTISVGNYTVYPGTLVPVEITVVDERNNPVSINLTVVVTGPDATDSLPPHEGKLLFTITTNLGAAGDQVEITNGKGTYEYTVPGDATAGTSYIVTASTEGTDKYAAAEGTGYIDVIQVKTTTTISNASGAPGETVTLDVEVTAEDGSSVNGEVVVTCPDGTKVTVTIKDGKGQFEWTIPEDAKDGDEFTFTATFEGNSTYLASNGTGVVTVVEPEPPEPVPDEPEVVPAKMLNTGNPLVALLAAFVLIGLGLKRREEE